MKTLDNYIIEKLKIDKDIKISEYDMYYVIPRNEVFHECVKKYGDTRINTNDKGYAGFILWKPDIKYLLKKYKDKITKYPRDFEIYEIPDEYDTWDVFKQDLEGLKIKTEDLVKINNEDFR